MANKYGKSEYSYRTRSAPLGVKILSILIVLGSIIGMAVLTPLLGYSPILIFVFVLWFTIQIVIAVNLWKLEAWAWKVETVLQSLGVIATLIEGMMITFVVSLFILLYLFAVRDAFSDGAY